MSTSTRDKGQFPIREIAIVFIRYLRQRTKLLARQAYSRTQLDGLNPNRIVINAGQLDAE